MTEVSRILQVINKKGIHARAAAKFVKTVNASNASVWVTKVKSATHHTADASQYAKVTGSSILGLMMLAAECGCSIEVTASGEDATKVLDELEALLGDKFGEGE